MSQSNKSIKTALLLFMKTLKLVATHILVRGLLPLLYFLGDECDL